MDVLPGWAQRLEDAAPDLVAAYGLYRLGRYLELKREVRRRSGDGSARRVAPQHAAITAHLEALLAACPAERLAGLGGEADWSLAQALGHAIMARQQLALAARLAASGRWPAQAPQVVPGVPGPADADLDALRRRLGRSQRFLDEVATRIAGHEEDPCPLEHPLVGHYRVGGWYLFAGVHDLMHVEQAERLTHGEA